MIDSIKVEPSIVICFNSLVIHTDMMDKMCARVDTITRPQANKMIR